MKIRIALILVSLLLVGAKCAGPADGVARGGARGSPPKAPSEAVVAVPDGGCTGWMFAAALAGGALAGMAVRRRKGSIA